MIYSNSSINIAATLGAFLKKTDVKVLKVVQLDFDINRFGGLDVRFAVRVQQRLGNESLRANVADKRPLVAVHCLYMYRQRTPLRVALIAKLATVPLLLRVDSTMRGEQLLRRKRFVARGATERLLPGVNRHVAPQRLLLAELFPANFAHVHLVQMLHLHVPS